MSQSPELRQDYWCNGDVTPTNGVRGAPVRNPVLLVERIERLPPIGACRRATPLVRRKFVENRHLQVTHCQRRFQRVFTQVIEIRCIAATTSVFSQAKADLGLIGDGEYDGQNRGSNALEVHSFLRSKYSDRLGAGRRVYAVERP